MKKSLLVIITLVLLNCSSSEPEPFMTYEQYYKFAAFNSGMPSNPDSITALGVGVKRLPKEVIEREIKTEPPGRKPLNNPEITIRYASILSELPALPEK